jgi:hypothetical protein
MPDPATETPRRSLADWNQLGKKLGPRMGAWLFATEFFAVIILAVSPIRNGSPILSAGGKLILLPAIFILGWLAGARTFAGSCQFAYRTQMASTVPLIVSLPILSAAVVALGLLGPWHWWCFAAVVAFLGHRKGTQRAYWAAVAAMAFSFRSPSLAWEMASGDDEALSMAIEEIKKSVGITPSQ